jgi:hypothetical protein
LAYQPTALALFHFARNLPSAIALLRQSRETNE